MRMLACALLAATAIMVLGGCGSSTSGVSTNASSEPTLPGCVSTALFKHDCSDRKLYRLVQGSLSKHRGDPQYYTAAAVALFSPYLRNRGNLTSNLEFVLSNGPDYGCLENVMLKFIDDLASEQQTAVESIAVYRLAVKQLADPLPPGIRQLAAWMIGKLAPTSPFLAAETTAIEGTATIAVTDSLPVCTN